MTKLSLDPCSLHLLYPRASAALPQKIRLLAQVEYYDYTRATFGVKKFPNLPHPHTQINIDEPLTEPESTMVVDVSYVVDQLGPNEASVGSTVSIIGFYNGSIVTAVECTSIETQHLHGRSLATLTNYASMRDLNK